MGQQRFPQNSQPRGRYGSGTPNMGPAQAPPRQPGVQQQPQGRYVPQGVPPVANRPVNGRPPMANPPQRGTGQQPFQGQQLPPPPYGQQKRQAPPPQRGGRPPAPPGNRQGRPPARKRKSPFKRLLVVIILLAVLGVGGYSLTTYNSVKNYDNVFFPNVYVNGIELSGMTAQEGIAAVRAKVQAVVDSFYIRFVYEGNVHPIVWRSGDVGLSYDEDSLMKAVNQAWQVGHNTRDIFSRKAALDEALQTPRYFASSEPQTTRNPVDDIVLRIESDIAANEAFHTVNATFTFHPENPQAPFTYTDEKEGKRLDSQALRDAINYKVSNMESGDIQLQLVPVYPTVTKAQLQQKTTRRYHATTKISSSSTDARNINVMLAASSVNGKVYTPGGVFKFNEVVGRRSRENGYQEADEYSYGKVVPGVGGGVCQVSSTLYQAAMFGGLEIVKREQHGLKVNYAEYAYDATVYWEGSRQKDFQFKNNTQSDIYILAWVETNSKGRATQCHVAIYGEDMGNVTYELKTHKRDVPPTGDVIIVETKQEEANAVYGVEVDWVLHRIENGVDVGPVKFNGKEWRGTDTYSGTPEKRMAPIY